MSNITTDEQRFKALFLLAGIDVRSWHELPNAYWPRNEHYTDVREAHPWQLALTRHGAVKIGWRKRVIEISWTDTPVRSILTEDDVTKEEYMVHAWGYVKALTYLTKLGDEFTNLDLATKEQAADEAA